MFTLNRHILTIIFFVCITPIYAGQIWYEDFSIPSKGIWGDADGITIHSDFSEITRWSLDFSAVKLAAPDDYAKTVSTSGGRFEVCDADGVVTWRSEWIQIKNEGAISLKLAANETGSGANESAKYLKAFYRLNGGNEILFGTNGHSAGNWGSAVAEQGGLSSDSIQIVVYMANSYSSDKVILDEVELTGEKTDTFAPFIVDIKIPAPDTLDVYFNEPILTSGLFAEMFSVHSESGHVQIRNVVEVSSTQVKIGIEPSLLAELNLVVSGIADLAGNITAANTFAFLYLPPVLEHDIVFNELMIDPTPPQALPDAEYIEIYNRAAYPIDLKGWVLKVENTEKVLPQYILLPGSYLIVTNSGTAESFVAFGNVLPVSSFPALKNNGSVINLFSDKNILIDQVSYSTGWFTDDEKSNGGWSFERMDPGRFCGTQNNWQYSTDLSGGTPGKENSVRKENPDNQPPMVLFSEATSPNQIKIVFNEPLDSTHIKTLRNYVVSDGVGSPESIQIISIDHILLNFANSFAEDKLYILNFSNMADECGNQLSNPSVEFSWSVARQGDLVINEILPNASSNGADFVELYNISEKYINISQLWLSNGKDTVALAPGNIHQTILNPGGFLALTNDSAQSVAPYPAACPENIVEIPEFPTIYNNEGKVEILNSEMESIDRFVYSSGLYTSIISNIEGISLERVSAVTPANDPENWLPASESIGFATPGCINSQTITSTATLVEFGPESISPNLDGYNDSYQIKYKLSKPGYVGNAWIYDISGRMVVQIAKNETLGTEGFIGWDGNDETGSRLPVGVYVVVFQMFDMHGNNKTYKDAVVLTDIFR